MTNSEKSGWAGYRPTKTAWFWSLVGASALTMVVGFAWGGWTTAGSARTKTAIAVRDARADLIADICVHNFTTASNAEENLKVLRDKSSWAREGYIKDGGWTNVGGIDEPVVNAADACAEQLLDLKQLPARDMTVTDS
ncbi:hypothetical protein [Neorhizobium sp. LjRoot104]|uniref:hypothetical protein n=1 Tax=Neorhizobium sp. LjRoot104 TaxID=3342254 RepID=UPI003ECDCFE2